MEEAPAVGSHITLRRYGQRRGEPAVFRVDSTEPDGGMTITVIQANNVFSLGAFYPHEDWRQSWVLVPLDPDDPNGRT